MLRKVFYVTIVMLLSMFSIQAQSWNQIGQDILGEEADDIAGASLSLSADGTILAIGATDNDGNGSNAGHVRVFENQNGNWTQIGQDIDGEAPDDRFGLSLSISADGSIVAIGTIYNDGNGSNSGHVQIYENVNGTWTQIGQDIDGETGGDYSGYSLSINSDGSIVAIGSLFNSGNGAFSGSARIFENQNGSWVQVGQDIDGEAASDFSGRSISLSSDGSIVAIGAGGNDGNGNGSGHVRVFENIGNVWTQIGQDIDGEAEDDFSGDKTSLSADGTVVAIGTAYNDGNGDNAGHVRIFENLNGTWTQIGQDIDGDAADDYSGWSIGLSSDGSRVAIGARLNDGFATDAGQVRIFENQGGSWVQLGPDIYGNAAEEYMGGTVSINADATIVAVSGPYGDNETFNPGTVRIYEYNSTQTIQITGQPTDQTNVCIDSNTSFTINAINVDTYQWQESTNGGTNFSNILEGGIYSDTTEETLLINGVTLGMDTYQYRCVLTSVSGNVTSTSAILALDNESPVIVTFPNDQIVDANSNCQASLDDYTGDITATDNCNSTNLTVTQSPVAGSTISGAANLVTLTVSDELGNDVQESFNVEVEDATDPVVVCIGNQTVDADETHFYVVNGSEFDPTDVSDNCGYSFENDFNNGTTLDGAQIPEGITTITWNITDTSGNVNNCSFVVDVSKYLSIQTLQQKGISIYPNPVDKILYFEFTNESIRELVFYDITGKKVLKKVVSQKEEAIDISMFESGMYILSFHSEEGSFSTRIIKR